MKKLKDIWVPLWLLVAAVGAMAECCTIRGGLALTVIAGFHLVPFWGIKALSGKSFPRDYCG